MTWLWRALRLIWLTAFGLFSIALCLLAWFLATPEGARQLSTLAQAQLPQLQLQLDGGTVISGLSAQRFAWTQDNLQIHGSDVSFRWRPRCLLQKTVCLDSLEAGKLTVTRHGDENEVSAPRTDELTLPGIALPLALDLGSLRVASLHLDLSEQRNPIVIRDIAASATLAGSELTLRNLSADYQRYRLAAEGSATLEGDYPLDLDLGAVIPLDALTPDTPLTIDGRLDGDLAHLALNAASGGPYHTTLVAQANVLDPALPLRAALQWENLHWPAVGQPRVNVSDGVLTLDGDLADFETTLNAQVSGLDIPETQVSLTGLLNAERIAASELELALLDGFVRGSATADWADGLDWQGRIWFEGINPETLVPEFPGDLHGSVLTRGELTEQGYQLELKPLVVQGQLRGFPVHLSANITHDTPDRWQLSQLQLISEDNRVTLDATLAEELKVKGRIDASALQQLLPDGGGSLSGSFAAAGTPTRPDLSLDLSSDALRYQDIQIRGLSLEADIRSAGTQSSRIGLTADRVDRDTTRIEALSLALDGSLDNHTIALEAKGPANTALDVMLRGALDAQQDWRGQLSEARLDVPAHTLTLTAPADLVFLRRQNQLTLAAHCWQSEDARLCLDEPLEAGVRGSVVASLNNYNLSRLDALLPQYTTLRGPTRAQLQVVWGAPDTEGPVVNLSAEVDDGRVSRLDPLNDETLNFDFRSLRLNSRTTQGLIDSKLSLVSDDLGNAEASISLDPSAVDGINIASGRLDFAGFDLAFLKAFFPRFETLAGTLSINGEVSGKLSAPAFNGRVVLDKPQLAAPDLPLSIDGGRVQARVSGDRAVIAGKLDSGNGQITVRGQADWRDPANWRSEIQLQGQSLVIHQKPVVESVMAPDIRLTLSPGRLQVGGEVRVIAAVINIREIPEGATTPSDDVIIIDSGSEESGADGGFQVTTNVRVVLGDAVRLSGYGLKAQLGGDFRVVQQPNRPVQLYGEINVPEGIYKSYGQDLTVEDGQILLVGPVAQTTLDIEAFREVDNIKAGLKITGNIESPVITLYSEPDMEQERILAYIVLGRDIEAGENNDSNILATAALSMGIANGRGLATDIAETFGIREFNIEASGRGEDTQVLLSGRLSSRLLVRYGVGVFTPVNTLYLRYDLTKRLYLETAQGVERAVDLFYSFDF